MTVMRSDKAARVHVREAIESELDDVGRIAVDAYRADGQLHDESEYEVALRDAAGRARDSSVLVAVDGGRVVGAVAVCAPGSRLAEISREGELEFRMLSVDPAAQGRGVGRALVAACIDRARALECRAVVICTRSDVADRARRMYRRLGFARLPDRDWTPVPGIELIAWEYALLFRSSWRVALGASVGRAALPTDAPSAFIVCTPEPSLVSDRNMLISRSNAQKQLSGRGDQWEIR